jgi:hypothetical protein
MRVTYLVIARLPAGGLETFDLYESLVLPLLVSHGGRLERRLRTPDELVEAHVVSFDSADSFAAYRDDPRRAAAGPVLERSGAVVELLEVADVPASQ